MVALAISLVLCATAGAAPVRGGATYDGRGRQPQFPLSPGGPDGSFIIQFRVTRDGRRVTELHVWGLPAACARPARSYIDPSPAVGSARIRSGGTFRADLEATISGLVGSKVIVTGRFLSHGRARGTLDYRGPRGPQRGCTADGSWAAHVKPPPPPVQHFTGTTAEGTRVTFERTIERHPHVKRFHFGSLRTSCGNTTLVETGPLIEAPFDQFALTVNGRRFSGHYSNESFYIDITGRFDMKNLASGTVRYGDRADCTTACVAWTAHPAA